MRCVDDAWKHVRGRPGSIGLVKRTDSHSNFFADLLSSPSETEGSLTPIARIALEDHDNSTVVTLLDLIAPSSLSQLPYPLATPDLMSVYRLADYLGCDAICKLLRSVVNDQANTAQLLQLASQTNDDADFIRQALTKARNRFLDVVDHASLVTSTALRIREEICTLPHRYRVELGLRLTMIHSNTGTYQKNWGGWEWLELGAEVDAFVKAIRGEPAVVQAQAEAEPKVRPTSAKPRRNSECGVPMACLEAHEG